MGTELTTFKDRPALSTKHAAFFTENKNIQDRETVPSLSPGGKQWTVSLNGEKTVLSKKDADGDAVPITTMKVVILDQNPTRMRSYYANSYDPDNATMPNCWSDDCVTPSKHVAKPMCANCAACPMSARGSRKTDNGKESVACQQIQFIAVVPASDLSYEPLRLKLAITSIWDGQNKENDAQGWFAFKNYTDFLRANGIDHTALLVTKMKFDPAVTYPKILFARDAFLTDAQLDQIVPIIQSPKVKQLLSTSWTPNGADGHRQEAIAGPASSAPAAQSGPAGPSAEEVAAKAAAEKKATEKAAKVAAAKAAEAAAEAARKAAEEDDDGDVVMPGTVAAAASEKAKDVTPKAAKKETSKESQTPADKPAGTAPPPGLAKLLTAWGDD